MVTCISLTTLGSSDSATSTWSATGLPVIASPLRPVSAIVSRPRSLAVASPVADHVLVAESDDPRVVKEMHVTMYHLLWELVHVFLEQPGTLSPGVFA